MGDRGDGSYFKFPNSAVDCGVVAGMARRTDLAVWLVLRRFENRGEAWPSLAVIGGRAGCARRHAPRALRNLEERGLVIRIVRGRGAERATHHRVPDVSSQGPFDER